MLDITFIIMFFLFGIVSIVLSKNKSNYKNLVNNNGERFADKVTKGLNVGGYVLLAISVLLFCSFIAGF